MIIEDLFNVHVAKSHGYAKYKEGDTAFITNGSTNNGVQGYVSPMRRDKVFKFDGICISAFCEATVQNSPFMGRGNGGSGIIVLEPKGQMDMGKLYYVSSYINNSTRWRFSYGRMVSKDRIMRIDIPYPPIKSESFDISIPLPEIKEGGKSKHKSIKYGSFKVSDLFNLYSGDYHNASALPLGDIPLVSCGNKNNGIMKFVSVPSDKIYQKALTIAYNGQPMTTQYHPYKFAAKDDVSVCTPKGDMNITTLIFIQYILNVEAWRFSFGRKCFREKLSYTIINLPVDRKGNIDQDIINQIVTNSSYWDYLEQQYSSGISLRTDIVQ